MVLLTEVSGVVVFGAMQSQGSQEGHDVMAMTLKHALTLTHYVHVVKLGKQTCAGGVDAADDGAPTVRKVLQEGYTLRT